MKKLLQYENGYYWGYDWDAITTEKLRLHEDHMQIGCDDHGWINLESLSVRMDTKIHGFFLQYWF